MCAALHKQPMKTSMYNVYQWPRQRTQAKRTKRPKNSKAHSRTGSLPRRREQRFTYSPSRDAMSPPELKSYHPKSCLRRAAKYKIRIRRIWRVAATFIAVISRNDAMNATPPTARNRAQMLPTTLMKELLPFVPIWSSKWPNKMENVGLQG